MLASLDEAARKRLHGKIRIHNPNMASRLNFLPIVYFALRAK
jgi:hypothetical protein